MAAVAPTAPSRIATALESCRQKLTVLCDSNGLRLCEAEVPLSLWKDELHRLRLWSANIGAHQRGQMSLDYRLRDASHIQNQIVDLLKSYQRTLEDLEAVGDIPTDINDDYWGFEDDSSVTEVQHIYQTIVETTDCLFRMSILIRQPVQYDRVFGARKDDAVGYEIHDYNHVSHKFPTANSMIVERLAKANSKRRRGFKHRERHHAKLSKGIDKAHDGKTTLFTPSEFSVLYEEGKPRDTISSSGQSAQTSLAMSLFSSDSPITIPPPPADSRDGRPFECPFCYFIITINSKKDWGQHVLKDVSPYVCVFPECDAPKHLYNSRRDWWQHVLRHKADGIDLTVCPLCQTAEISRTPLQQHIGRHLEELALFAVPRGYDVDEDDGEGTQKNTDVVETSSSNDVTDAAQDLEIREPVLQENVVDTSNVILETQPRAPRRPASTGAAPQASQIQIERYDDSSGYDDQSDRNSYQTYEKGGIYASGNILEYMKEKRTNITSLKETIEDERQERRRRMDIERRKEEYEAKKEKAREKERRNIIIEEARNNRLKQDTEREDFLKDFVKNEVSTKARAAEEKAFEEKVKDKFRNAGYSDEHIQEVTNRKKDENSGSGREWSIDLSRPTFIKVNRKYLLPDTLDHYNLPWEWDRQDPEFIIIKRYIDHDFQDELFEHTRRLSRRKLVTPGKSSEGLQKRGEEKEEKQSRGNHSSWMFT